MYKKVYLLLSRGGLYSVLLKCTHFYSNANSTENLYVLNRGLPSVYSFGPTFRAEHSDSSLHLAEFYMLEAEWINLESLEELMSFVQRLVHHCTRFPISNHSWTDASTVLARPWDNKGLAQSWVLLVHLHVARCSLHVACFLLT